MVEGAGRQKNKFKQIIQIDGHPEQIMKTYEASYYYITGEIDGKPVKVSIGKAGPRTAGKLKQMGINVTCEVKTNRRVVDLPLASSTKLMKQSTLIEVGAPTEDELNGRVYKIISTLKSRGVQVRERCEWVCKVDKKDIQEPMEKENNGSIFKDAVSALVNLGFKMREAREAVSSVNFDFEGKTVETLVRDALLKLKPQTQQTPERVIHESPVTPVAKGAKAMSDKTKSLRENVLHIKDEQS